MMLTIGMTFNKSSSLELIDKIKQYGDFFSKNNIEVRFVKVNLDLITMDVANSRKEHDPIIEALLITEKYCNSTSFMLTDAITPIPFELVRFLIGSHVNFCDDDGLIFWKRSYFLKELKKMSDENI